MNTARINYQNVQRALELLVEELCERRFLRIHTEEQARSITEILDEHLSNRGHLEGLRILLGTVETENNIRQVFIQADLRGGANGGGGDSANGAAAVVASGGGVNDANGVAAVLAGGGGVNDANGAAAAATSRSRSRSRLLSFLREFGCYLGRLYCIQLGRAYMRPKRHGVAEAEKTPWAKRRGRNVEEKLLNLCDTTDESKPPRNVLLWNCISLSSSEADSEKLPPRPERLSVYSKSFSKLGFSQEELASDTVFWQEQVRRCWELMKINEAEIRNVMDMNAALGGFAGALNTFPVWVMNIGPISANNTVSAVYDRGLVGTYHDWCEPFFTYPRTYDLLHANNLLACCKNGGEGCLLEDIILEMDRILRPEVLYDSYRFGGGLYIPLLLSFSNFQLEIQALNY
ncbi:hypothetical protein NL676_016970 [Syzygium grande]|nr:hypothetical protein NL676_016970 [Syzygium grande]